MKKATAHSARPAKATSAAQKRSGPGATNSAATQTVKSRRRGAQPPLRQVLTNLLQKSRKPLSAAELAKRARAAGYRTNSAKFSNVVWAMLGEMDNLERVPGQGYRFKKGQA